MMRARTLGALVVGAVLVASAAAVALPSQAADQANRHADDHADRSSAGDAGADRADQAEDRAAGQASDEAGPNEHALFGLCTAWQNNATGREHGDAEEAHAFQWLIDRASDLATDTFCDDVDHPADGRVPSHARRP